MIGNFDRIYLVNVGGQVPYLLKNVSDLSQVPIKRHRLYSRTLTTNDPLWVGDDSKVSQSIIPLTTTPSSCELLNNRRNTRIATLLSMVPVTLPNTGFCAFSSLSADTPDLRVMLDIDRSTKIVKKQKYHTRFSRMRLLLKILSGPLEVGKFEGANV